MLSPFPESLRTERLLLERMRAADRDELHRMHRDPRVMATLGGLRDDAEAERYLATQLAHWETHGFGLWTVRDPASRAFLGRGGLREVALDDGVAIELAYALVPGAWGRGLATELALTAVRISLEVLGRADVVAYAQVGNRASRRVMEKAGLVFERELIRKGATHALYRRPPPP